MAGTRVCIPRIGDGRETHTSMPRTAQHNWMILNFLRPVNFLSHRPITVSKDELMQNTVHNQ